MLRVKALEHIELLKTADPLSGPILDIGCGAGELFEHYKDIGLHVRGVDPSSSMIHEAKLRLGSEAGLVSVQKETLSVLREDSSTVWLSTAALGQYGSRSELSAVADAFCHNPSVRVLALLDVIHPTAYMLWKQGLLSHHGFEGEGRGMTSGRVGMSYLARGASFLRTLLASTSYSSACLLPGNGGYAYRPGVLISIFERPEQTAEVTSSRYYEYRYHLLIRKGSQQSLDSYRESLDL